MTAPKWQHNATSTSSWLNNRDRTIAVRVAPHAHGGFSVSLYLNGFGDDQSAKGMGEYLLSLIESHLDFSNPDPIPVAESSEGES